MSRIRADRYTNRLGTGAPLFSNGVNITGNVGVGTTVPTSKLTVLGDMNVSGIITAQSGVHVTSGDVGIGTDNPSQELSIYGTGSVRTEIVCTNYNDAGAGIYLRTMNGGSTVSNATLNTNTVGDLLIWTGTSGATEKLRISANGIVTKPNNPSFRATREGSDQTASTNNILEWNTVSGANRSFDTYTTDGYGFNTSTYKYKVPVTGVWYFHASVYTNSGQSCMFDIRTSSQIFQRAEDNAGSSMPNNNIVHASCVVTCSKDDEVYVHTSGGQSKLIQGSGYISFDGHFIG